MSSKPPQGVRAPRGKLLAAAGLFLVAAAIAAYLAWLSFSGASAIGCGPESGCDRVLHSKWAYWFSIPVSLLALPVYTALSFAALRMSRPISPFHATVARAGCLLVMGAAVWFIALQFGIIKGFCIFCTTAHAAGVAGSLLLWSSITSTGKVAKGRPPSAMPLQPAAAPAAVLLAALIAGQILQPERERFAIAPAPVRPGVIETNAPPAVPPVVAKTKRLLPIYGGQFQLPVDELPVIGSVAVPHLVVSLFDYTCHHCRTMHERLLHVQRTFSNQLAIISLPMPLDPVCNTNILQMHPDHVNACEYARLGLAVWRARPSALGAYDHVMFAPPRPPSIAEARNQAARLVGLMALDASLADPWINEQIRRDIAIYETAYRAGQGSMPQLIIGSKVAVGTLPIENVYQLIEQELGLKAPAGVEKQDSSIH